MTNLDIVRIPIDQFVCDGCNTAITDIEFVCIEEIAYLLEHGLYCAHCHERYYSEEKPIRIYLKGQIITDLSKEMCIGSIEEFDPEKHR